MTRAQVSTGPGIFGPKTEAALRRFQAEHGLTRDGIYGPNTFRALQNATPRTNGNGNGNNQQNQPPVGDGEVQEYRRWNVYSTGNRPARQSDGYEDLQPHHDYQSVNYVMRGLRLTHRLEARDIVLTRPGQSNFGQAVPSPLEGEVLFAGNENDGYGNKVVVRNNRTGEIAMVGHLQSVNVRTGDRVSYGQNLGGQGSTGHSTGAHVHINADPSVIRRWVADLADGRFDGVRGRFDVGQRP
jgi:peptidoglycan hydrolase-like protein with peptidoglycan-binding domain